MDDDLMTDVEKLRWLVRAVGYVGVDFEFGEFQLNNEHVEVARYLDGVLKDPNTILSIRKKKELAV